MDLETKKRLRQKIHARLKAAIAGALAEHRRAGRKVAIWSKGRVMLVIPESTDTVTLNEKSAEF